MRYLSLAEARKALESNNNDHAETKIVLLPFDTTRVAWPLMDSFALVCGPTSISKCKTWLRLHVYCEDFKPPSHRLDELSQGEYSGLVRFAGWIHTDVLLHLYRAQHGCRLNYDEAPVMLKRKLLWPAQPNDQCHPSFDCYSTFNLPDELNIGSVIDNFALRIELLQLFASYRFDVTYLDLKILSPRARNLLLLKHDSDVCLETETMMFALVLAANWSRNDPKRQDQVTRQQLAEWHKRVGRFVHAEKVLWLWRCRNLRGFQFYRLLARPLDEGNQKAAMSEQFNDADALVTRKQLKMNSLPLRSRILCRSLAPTRNDLINKTLPDELEVSKQLQHWLNRVHPFSRHFVCSSTLVPSKDQSSLFFQGVSLRPVHLCHISSMERFEQHLIGWMQQRSMLLKQLCKSDHWVYLLQQLTCLFHPCLEIEPVATFKNSVIQSVQQLEQTGPACVQKLLQRHLHQGEKTRLKFAERFKLGQICNSGQSFHHYCYNTERATLFFHAHLQQLI